MKIAVAVALFVMPAAAVAESLPDAGNGRYAFSPTSEGVARLDTRSGAVATCTDRGSGWACYSAPDERAAFDAEIGRLLTENATLKLQLAQREAATPGKTDEALPKQDSLKPKVADGGRKIEIPLPSDRDMDRMVSFVESAWRRLVDMANRLQRDVSGRI